MATAYLGLGSNKGERITYIERAMSEISKIQNTKIVRSSAVYETEPWGFKDQEEYLNSAVEIETELDAFTLLKELKEIEKRIGRTEDVRWSEREIDIDLLFYGKEILVNDIMNVPHKEIENRKFVLIPMNEIAPDFIHPVFKKNMSELLKGTKDKLKVSKYNHSFREK